MNHTTLNDKLRERFKEKEDIAAWVKDCAHIPGRVQKFRKGNWPLQRIIEVTDVESEVLISITKNSRAYYGPIPGTVNATYGGC